MSNCPNCKKETWDSNLQACSSCGWRTLGSVSLGSLQGQIGCDSFWSRTIWLLTAALVPTLFLAAAFNRLSGAPREASPLVGLLSVVLSLACIVYGLALVWLVLCFAVQRCHDMGRSPTILLWGLTALACPILMIYLASARGAIGPNMHGSEPMRTGKASEPSLCGLAGRIGRASYWIRGFAPFGAIVLLSMLTYLIPSYLPSSSGSTESGLTLARAALVCAGVLGGGLGLVAVWTLWIALTWLGIAAGVKRCHDLGWSGWVVLLHLVPIVGAVIVLWLGCVRGNLRTNEYGPSPFAAGEQSIATASGAAQG